MTSLRRTHSILTTISLVVLLPAFIAEGLRAETIVLKNGRRIVAEGIVERGDKLSYQGPYGEVTIPRNQVERIEQGGTLPPPSANSGGMERSYAAFGAPVRRDPGRLPLTLRLPAGNFESILLRDGTVNERLLADLGREAWDGDIQRQNATNAHLLAAAYEVRNNRTAGARRLAEQALVYGSQNRDALLLAAQIDLLSRDYSEAREHLLVAQANFPESADILGLLGYAAYYAEGAEKALFYLKQAYALSPDPALKSLMDELGQEAAVESQQRQAESYHFTLSWEGPDRSEKFGKDVLEALEQCYRELEIALNFSPREPVVVILYTRQQYMDITKAPAWSGALNDGKIRIPVGGLDSVTPRLTELLKHELTHSFIFQFAQGRVPVWLNEGIAQNVAGESSSEYAAPLSRIFSAKRAIPMEQLEGSFTRFDSRTALVAYAQSVAAVEMIRERHGPHTIPGLLTALRDGRPMAEALRGALRLSYADLDEQLAEYVHAKYIK
jgi:tetratricopeptide (TPR) repeat protein